MEEEEEERILLVHVSSFFSLNTPHLQVKVISDPGG